jgi:WD40 repeat protein/class 3 adenylate cyclase
MPQGLLLRHTLEGHAGAIVSLAWSTDGIRLATTSNDATIRIWNAGQRQLLKILKGHTQPVIAVAWSKNGELLVTGSKDNTARVWDVATGQCLQVLAGHQNDVLGVAFSQSGEFVATASRDKLVRLWDWNGKRLLLVFREHTAPVHTVAWSDDQHLVSASQDRTVRMWTMKGQERFRLDGGASIAWTPDFKTFISGSYDGYIFVREIGAKKQRILEGHTEAVDVISFSADRRFFVTRSLGMTRIWRCDTWETVAAINELTSDTAVVGTNSVAFHPTLPLLAMIRSSGTSVRLFDIKAETLLNSERRMETVHYANAKVVLVGETGVGKTGLAMALMGKPFVPTDPTRGRNVGTFSHQEVTLENGRRETREILLWDLAGQPGYRLVHQLHLTDIAVALVVFDASNDADNFRAVHQWMRTLRQAQQVDAQSGAEASTMRVFLVAARCDETAANIPRAKIDALVRSLKFDGYFETSAKDGWDIDKLREAIQNTIAWANLPRVSSTTLFQKIRTFLAREKEKGRLLSSVDDLYRSFLLEFKTVEDNPKLRAQFDTCIGRVEWRGLIRRLSFGGFVLLQSELLDVYASSIIGAARTSEDGFGSVLEDDIRAGRFDVPEEWRVADKAQERLLILATVEDLLRHDIAVQETAESGSYLVFPSQIRRQMSELPDPEDQSIMFDFEGAIENIYSTLAVRLLQSGIWTRKEMWQNAVTFATKTGGVCGMFLTVKEEGIGTLTVFYEDDPLPETRYQFEEYIFQHLRRRALPDTVKRRKRLVCPECKTPVPEDAIQRRIERNRDFIICNVCDAKLPLTDSKSSFAAAPTVSVASIDRAADERRSREVQMVSASAEIGSRRVKEWAGSSIATLALVFTDIVGSTAMANELGDEAYQQIRRKHFAQARRLIQSNDGCEIKTIGDAYMIAFRSVPAALSFALALYRDTGDPNIRVRAGIHVGPVYVEDQDAFGTMVNFASRVVAQAEGAEIWLSNDAKSHIDMVGLKNQTTLPWLEHKNCTLKGFSGAYTLWSLVTGY